jgi:DNA mismatch endonuclease Vsr
VSSLIVVDALQSRGPGSSSERLILFVTRQVLSLLLYSVLSIDAIGTEREARPIKWTARARRAGGATKSLKLVSCSPPRAAPPSEPVSAIAWAGRKSSHDRSAMDGDFAAAQTERGKEEHYFAHFAQTWARHFATAQPRIGHSLVPLKALASIFGNVDVLCSSIDRQDLTGRPDVVFPCRRAVIFVHGCFWHRHAGCRRSSVPSTRTEYWMAKFKRNVARDKAAQRALKEHGWRVLFVWECETYDPDRLRRRLHAFLGSVAAADSPRTAGAKRVRPRRTAVQRVTPFVPDLLGVAAEPHLQIIVNSK